MDFNLNSLLTKLNNIQHLSNEIDSEENIKKYGTFLDSKKDIVQLYILFIFFGIHMDVIQQFPESSQYKFMDYDPD
mgnify:CR=1 FL=1|tara:strand:+ start:77 stop:304 length:228 start_codon:yes stop_codon:yes gene_type:complete